ncbi:MAG: hypothetical protein R3245_01770 [Kiloniellales bacterium]|nr:hypothetical protein [Kiloniellales bacterium]
MTHLLSVPSLQTGRHRPKSCSRLKGLSVVVFISGALLAGCSMNRATQDTSGIGFREARYADVSAMRDFRSCQDEAIELDRQARSSGDSARYLASARLLERCEAELGPDVAGISKEERMRGYGLTILNYLKGGDAASARRNLERYRQAFPDNDLYYADGSSFRETMETVLGQRDDKEYGQFALLNVSAELKDEMRRMTYWKDR